MASPAPADPPDPRRRRRKRGASQRRRPRRPRPQQTVSGDDTLAAPQDGRFVLCLYVTGSSPRSLSAIDAITKFCDQALPGRYDLRVIDIYQQPLLAKDEQIIAAPTLVKQAPGPARRLIGNLTDARRVRLSLGLPDTAGGTIT